MDRLISDFEEILINSSEKKERLELAYKDAEKQLIELTSKYKQKVLNRNGVGILGRVSEDNDENADTNNFISKAMTNVVRPVRTAKTNAVKNLKEPSAVAKMRNENNVAVIIREDKSIDSSNSDVLVNVKHEKSRSSNRNQNKRQSPDESSPPPPPPKSTGTHNSSIEIIPTKPVQIELLSDSDGADKMPPPLAPVPKKTKRVAKKASTVTVPEIESEPIRITRSKIKKEKPSLIIDESSVLTETTTIMPELIQTRVTRSKSSDIQQQLVQSEPIKAPTPIPEPTLAEPDIAPEATKKTKKKKKCPMPMLIKTEKLSESSMPQNKEDDPILNETYNMPPLKDINTIDNKQLNDKQTTKITKNKKDDTNEDEMAMSENNDTFVTANGNETVTVAITETINNQKGIELIDNNNQLISNIPQIKLKKNEVFNPYLQSPVKKRVEAFEKHAVASNTGTPEINHSTKYRTCVKQSTVTTPLSKLHIPQYKTLPSSTSKLHKFGGNSGLSTSAHKLQQSKVYSGSQKSLSQESLNDVKKMASSTNLLEEKRRMREEKQKQAQMQREQLEKERRELALKQTQEREERFKKTMQEKEEKHRQEQLKKKMLKEKQEKRLAEERLRKEELLVAKMAIEQPTPERLAHNNSLHLKLQRQMMMEKAEKNKKTVDPNEYGFDMLHTDDSTDDESRPSVKRPPPPEWSKKSHRKRVIESQTYINNKVVDTLFAVEPISVDLREIFPAIDQRKLARNSSAVWNTPPRYSQMPKY